MMGNLGCQVYTFGKWEPEQISLQQTGSWNVCGAFSWLLVNVGEPTPLQAIGDKSGRGRTVQYRYSSHPESESRPLASTQQILLQVPSLASLYDDNNLHVWKTPSSPSCFWSWWSSYQQKPKQRNRNNNNNDFFLFSFFFIKKEKFLGILL